MTSKNSDHDNRHRYDNCGVGEVEDRKPERQLKKVNDVAVRKSWFASDTIDKVANNTAEQ